MKEWSLSLFHTLAHFQSHFISHSNLWVADNRAFPSLLPKPQVATKADLARPNTHEPETLWQPGGPATHCYLCFEEWRDHLTNEEEEEEDLQLVIFMGIILQPNEPYIQQTFKNIQAGSLNPGCTEQT